MPNEHRADPTPPPHHGQGRGGSKKESSSLRVSPALHPPERPSPRRADIADHGLGRETRERRYYTTRIGSIPRIIRLTSLVRPSIASPTFLLYFQVNTVVGRFWIMLKISTWLVGRLLRFFLKKPFTLCTSFHNLHNLS